MKLRAGLLALALLAPRGAFALDRTVLPANSTWRYDTGTDRGTLWRAPAFDDGVWPQGPGVLGFGDPFITTLVPMGPNATTRYPTTYFRSTFEVPDDPSLITGLTLTANYDDGFVAWLNGAELARRGLAAGAVAYGTLATSHEGGAYETIDVSALRALLVPGTNTLAVEVHQTTSASSDLAWDASLRYTTGAATVTRGPYLQMGAPGAMTVRWRTSVPTDSRVRVGPAPGALSDAAQDATLTTEHELRVTGLSPATRYTYAVGTASEVLTGDDAATWFDTPPAAGAPATTRIWVLGDSGLPGAPQSRVRDAYQAFTGATPTDVWLMLGDNAYTAGADGDYTAGLFSPYAAFLRTHVLWPTRGNHDILYTGPANDYYDLFTMPTAAEAGGLPSATEAWYSFDHGDAHFVCLDSEGSDRSPAGAMLTWLEADLAATDRKWVIAFWHHPPYTKGSHDSDDALDSGGRMRDMRENALPVLEAYGVDLVLNGHSHSYERSFLVDGHYGLSGTLTPAMLKDAGDGRPGGDGAYVKLPGSPQPHEGEVVAVAGSSAQTSGGALNHPVMARSLDVLGSMVIDLRSDELDAVFLDDLGAVRDSFVIAKRAVVVDAGDAPRTELGLALAGANPSRGECALAVSLPRAGRARLTVVDAAGRIVRRVFAGARAAGESRAAWDGLGESQRPAPPGVYFAVLEFEGAHRVARLVRL